MIVVFKSDYVDLDRWIIFDRYPRRFFNKIRSKSKISTGQTKALKNLLLGLELGKIEYRLNPAEKAIRNEKNPILLFGQSKVIDYLEKFPTAQFIVGPALYSHPLENPRLSVKNNVKRILVPGPWMESMCKPYWGSKVVAWPVGIDTNEWSVAHDGVKTNDLLIYEKIMWDSKKQLLLDITPILNKLDIKYDLIHYGNYQEEEYKQKLKNSRAMLYLSEHETQGIAYQQALAMGIPVLAWDRNSYWLDPRFYPERVCYKPASSVPYWDQRCGEKFSSIDELENSIITFLDNIYNEKYDPRSYVMENLSLELSTRNLLNIMSAEVN